MTGIEYLLSNINNIKGIGSKSDDNYNSRNRLNEEDKPFELKGFKLFKKFIHGR